MPARPIQTSLRCGPSPHGTAPYAVRDTQLLRSQVLEREPDEGCLRLPIAWPGGVPVQVHGMDADPIFAGEGDIDAARELTGQAKDAELFLYPGDQRTVEDLRRDNPGISNTAQELNLATPGRQILLRREPLSATGQRSRLPRSPSPHLPVDPQAAIRASTRGSGARMGHSARDTR